MALTMNSITVLGYVGQDPKRYENSGATVFSVATNEPKKNSDESITTWFSCIAWGDTGQAVKDKLCKGDLVHLQGRLRQTSYTDKDDVERIVLELHVGRWSRISEVKKKEPQK